MGIQDSETEKWSHCNLTFFFCWPVGEDILDFFKSAQGWDSIGAARLYLRMWVRSSTNQKIGGSVAAKVSLGQDTEPQVPLQCVYHSVNAR